VELILASAECDPAHDIICAPSDVNELFEFREAIFSLGPFPITRTVFLILGIAVIVSAVLFFGLRKKALVPGKFQTIVESIIEFVRDGIAIEIIGEHGAKYAPWLLSIFLFVLVGNLYEVTPFINFPVTSRMALPLMLAVITWVIFVIAGIKRQGLGYFLGIVWPKSVPMALRPLVGLIEFFSILLLRHTRDPALRQPRSGAPHADASARVRLGVHLERRRHRGTGRYRSCVVHHGSRYLHVRDRRDHAPGIHLHASISCVRTDISLSRSLRT